MKIRLLLTLLLIGSFLANTVAQKAWLEIRTVEDMVENYPETIKTMFEQFDLDYPGLEKVKEAHQNGDLSTASKELLAYYKNGNQVPELRREQPAISNRSVASADTILANVYEIQNVRGQVPVLPDGHRDWYYKGPNNDREWAWLSNRHSQVGTLLNVYLETGNPKYAQYIDELLRDFIIKSMPYPAVKGSESIWRGLEVAARTKVWSRVFYGLINSNYLTPAARLLMLSSLADHAHYNRNFHGGNNWLTMEISALATVAANFPEYKQSDAWLDYSVGAMVESMKDQVYPDGIQTELTSHYHNVSLANFELFKNICDRAGKDLPDFFTQTIEDMYRYIAHAVRPDGFRILNNDGDRGSDRDLILKGAEIYNRPDWEYIATNGASGTKPEDGPSYFMPWAGQMISRSGFDAQAHWSFFDIGPWGSGHQHNDKLHLSISAFERDFLVDAGRFAYTGEVAEKFRPYAKGSQGHNLIMIDGKGQDDGPTHAQEPVDDKHFLVTSEYDYASDRFDSFKGLEGNASHLRSLMYVRGEFWVVVDKVITDRPRTIEALWHWHPDNEVVKEGQIVKTMNTAGNLAILPIGSTAFDIQFVKGQESPEIQGWYSPEYNVFGSNVASIYRAEIEGTATIAWLILPASHEIPNATTEILAENEEGVTISVVMNGEKWILEIPFLNSSEVKVKME
ncbi:alginate lyase family protein [Lunatibacter salilacus]|uniref:alginate lyase family protein n=1 Tax=Lunatibacter salilacus TaxID=2483804 RepID=UPI00131E68AD|nr:alginate lyase family protein [Lunatibacter salilacus]